MERRLFMNEFEQSLKEQADQFQMVPSKKVWHGIYNDLHPGRKWPSIAMSLSLIFTLVFIGHMHIHNQHNIANSSTLKVDAVTATSINSEKNIIEKNDKKSFPVNNRQKSNQQTSAFTQKSNSNSLPTKLAVNNSDNNLLNESLITNNKSPDNILNSVSSKTNFSTLETDKNAYAKKLTGIIDDKKQSGPNEYEKLLNVISEPVFTNPGNFNKDRAIEKNIADERNLNNQLSSKAKSVDVDKAPESKAYDENKMASTKIHRKRDEKINWVYFAAPVASTVSFSGEFLKEVSTNNFTAVLQRVNQKENKVLHNSALGFEAGAQMNYLVAKKLQFTTGVHLTYSGYHIISNQVHPTQSNLVLKDPSTGMTYTQSYITHYGDGTGLAITTLRNYSWQASIPIGLQYSFYDAPKVQFSIAADIEPSFVLKANSFMLSSNGNNYVNDPSLLRKWNFNSNFGTFVSFNSAKFHWQIGPNVRYQWLSTYQKNYTVNEHLIDYGIRIGISKIQ